MADYSDQQESAYNAIKDNGTTISIRKFTEGTYNPATDSYTGSTWTSYTAYAVMSRYKERDVDGTLVKKGDKRMLIPAYNLTVTLEEGDIIRHSSKDWRVVDPNPIEPDGTVIIYKAQVRV